MGDCCPQSFLLAPETPSPTWDLPYGCWPQESWLEQCFTDQGSPSDLCFRMPESGHQGCSPRSVLPGNGQAKEDGRGAEGRCLPGTT